MYMSIEGIIIMSNLNSHLRMFLYIADKFCIIQEITIIYSKTKANKQNLIAKSLSLGNLCYQCSVPLFCHNELHCHAALTQRKRRASVLYGKVKPVRMAQHSIHCDATMADCILGMVYDYSVNIPIPSFRFEPIRCEDSLDEVYNYIYC